MSITLYRSRIKNVLFSNALAEYHVLHNREVGLGCRYSFKKKVHPRPNIYSDLGCSEWQQQGLNPPQVVFDQVSAYKTEMDSIAQFIEQEVSLEADTKYSASKLYEDYRQFCQGLGRKPQSTNAFKKSVGVTSECLPASHF